MLKNHKFEPLGIIMAGLALGSVIVGCRSSAAPSHTDAAIFNPAVTSRRHLTDYAAAHDNADRLQIARAAALDASLTPNASAAWLMTWRDLAFAEAKITVDLLQALATTPLASDVDANLFRAFTELAPETNPRK